MKWHTDSSRRHFQHFASGSSLPWPWKCNLLEPKNWRNKYPAASKEQVLESLSSAVMGRGLFFLLLLVDRRGHGVNGSFREDKIKLNSISLSFIDPAWISPLESIEGKAGRFGKQKDLYTWRQVSMLTLEPDEQAPSGRHTFLLGLWLINICHALREKPRSFQSPARGSPSQSSSNQTGSTDVCT